MPEEALNAEQLHRAKNYALNFLAEVYSEGRNGELRHSDVQREEILKDAIERVSPALKDEVKRLLEEHITRAVTEREPDQLNQAFNESNTNSTRPENAKSDQFIFNNFAAIERELRGDKPLGNSLHDQVEIFQAALRRTKDPEIREQLEVRLVVARIDLLEEQTRSPDPARAPQNQPNPRQGGNLNGVENEVRRIVQEAHRDLNQRNGAPLEPNLENRVTILLEAIPRASNREVRQSLEENLSKTLAAAELQRQNPAGLNRGPLAASPQAVQGLEQQTNRAEQAPSASAYSSSDKEAAAKFVTQVIRENHSAEGSATRWRDLSTDTKAAILLDASARANAENKTGAVNYLEVKLNEVLARGERSAGENQLQASDPSGQLQRENALDERSRSDRGRDPDGRAPEGRAL